MQEELQVGLPVPIDDEDEDDYDVAVKEKETAEQAVTTLLGRIKTCAQQKLHLARRRQQQKENMLSCLLKQQQQFPNIACSSSTTASLSVADVKAQNSINLQSSHALLAAFANTQKARDCLLQCLKAETGLLASLETPLQQAFAQSLQLVHFTRIALQKEDPQRECRHTEMMLRYNACCVACTVQ